MEFIKKIRDFISKKFAFLYLLKEMFTCKELSAGTSSPENTHTEKIQIKKVWLNKNGKNVLIDSRKLEKYLLDGYSRGMTKRVKCNR